MSDEQLLTERVQRLEELVAHQEHTISQLNELVVELRADCEKLVKQFLASVDRLEADIESRLGGIDPDEKPPHY